MKLKIALVDDVESDLLLLETDLMCAAKGRHQITFLKYKSGDLLLSDDITNFDIIFLDPPYKMNNVDEILSLIYQYKLLKSKGIIAFEMESQTNPDSKYYKIIKDRSYGIKRVVIYKEEI